MRFLHELARVLGWSVFGLAIFCLVISGAYHLAYKDKVLPKVKVSGVDLSNLNEREAENYLRQLFSMKPNQTKVFFEGKTILKVDKIGLDYDFAWGTKLAMNVGRGGNPLTEVTERIKMFWSPVEVKMPIKYSEDDFEGMITRVVEDVNQEGEASALSISLDKKTPVIVFKQGKNGKIVDEERLRNDIAAALARAGEQKVVVEVKTKTNEVSDSEAKTALAVANYWLDKKLRLYFRDYNLNLSINEILPLIHLGDKGGDSDYGVIVSRLVEGVESKPKDAIFQFEDGKVKAFEPEKDGVEIRKDELLSKLRETIEFAVKTDLEIPVTITKPKVTVEEINDLGIKELIAVGTSLFHNSIPNRIHNLTLASNKLNGVVVAPGETFSMNAALGEVSRATGYKEAYVISAGRTVLGDGGGVCQTSTTMFRTALNAGLPIVERKSHAYRVHYYEDDLGPGYDSTIFGPTVDLKFINDTPAHILIQTKVDPKNFSLRYEFYGTKDDRVVNLSKARFLSQSPALGTTYQDDPTLPMGTLRQVDWSAPGAKVSFDYKVTRGGETLQDKTFVSTYQPWAAVYLRGTGTN